MRTLEVNEIESVSGGLSLKLGQLVVGQGTTVGLATSGGGILGSLLGTLSAVVSVPTLLSLAPTSLDS